MTLALSCPPEVAVRFLATAIPAPASAVTGARAVEGKRFNRFRFLVSMALLAFFAACVHLAGMLPDDNEGMGACRRALLTAAAGLCLSAVRMKG